MKKKIMLVSAMVVMAMSAMFVACNQNTPSTTEEDTMKNGCICTVTPKDGDAEKIRIPFEEMVDYYNAETCSELASAIKDHVTANTKVSCKGY